MENFVFISPEDESNESPAYQIFQYLIYLMNSRDQLRMNHWQTQSYAEHKATDKLIGKFTELIDELGETALGEFGRPQITPTNNVITDINLFSSSAVLESLDEYTKQIHRMCESSEEPRYGINKVLDDIMAVIKQGRYLLTLD